MWYKYNQNMCSARTTILIILVRNSKYHFLTLVRPLLNLPRDRFLRHFPVTQNLSIDESMIPHFGRHGAKHCIRNKPIRFGYKVLCLCTPDGCLGNFEPYQGSNRKEKHPLHLGGSVVERLFSDLPQHPYCLYTDNFSPPCR